MYVSICINFAIRHSAECCLNQWFSWDDGREGDRFTELVTGGVGISKIKQKYINKKFIFALILSYMKMTTFPCSTPEQNQ